MTSMYVDDVFVVDLVPVVREKMPGKPGPADTWSDEQIALLKHLKTGKGFQWPTIGRMMQRPWKSCQRKWRALAIEPTPEPEPKALSADAPQPHRLHEELGIRTYTVSRTTQISVPRVGGFTYVDKVLSITLSGGHK